MTDPSPSILTEAENLVSGDRQAAYGHPLDNWGHIVDMFNALFKKKLKEDFTPEDLAYTMVLVKLSRETYLPKRDNRVDIAGYVKVADEIINERERRKLTPEILIAP